MTNNVVPMKRPHETILQIMPALGWWAKYTMEDGTIELMRVVCFALVQWDENGQTWQTVRPMDCDDTGEMDLAHTTRNFAGLVHEEDPAFERLKDRRPTI